ncbi:LOW QUALITY PROTEIN: uncharacterized protein LOC128641694 [Bombina bombina]|uniref:LOW QUALITY PROTEIN: uncharacterized protein LOC128641694 n=1 Tax=Bombina bombina TaxID=8345 RepID=UPI00235B2D0C|nr:LOW QUALITY PROTEIN: uncharacterized protein LOC128641694 [Bombina bombina]
MACKMEKVDDTIAENVSKWVLNYIKRHGGPYEIPAEYRQSWDLMKEFLAKMLYDKNVSENKRKGWIMQGLLFCCLKLEEIIKEKDSEISQLNSAVMVESMENGELYNELNDKIVDMRVHAVVTGEALIEKAKVCDTLTEQNEQMNERILELEREVDECRYVTNMAFNRMAESMVACSMSPAPKVPKVTESVNNSGTGGVDIKQKPVINLPAAPTTVLNHDNSGEVRLVTKDLKPQEMDNIVNEIGQVPQQDFNCFLQWLCNFKRITEMYNLTVDIKKVWQRAIGNGLWVRIVQRCGQTPRTADIFKEIMHVLYGIHSDVSLCGKIKQLKNESPYELSDRISTVLKNVIVHNSGFEHGGMVHRTIFLDALEENIRESILSVTPNPSDLNDILLRADNLWRKIFKNNISVVASVRGSKEKGQNYHCLGISGSQYGQKSQNYKRKLKSKTWIPFSQIKNEYEELKTEYNKIKHERDQLKEQIGIVKAKCRCNMSTGVGVVESPDTMDICS